MVSVEINRDEVTLRILGHHQLWAVKKVIRFKKDHVQAVTRVDTSLRPPWRRCPGTYLPGFICAGTYHGEQGKEFWDTAFKGNAIEIILRQEQFARMVVDVENPDEVIERLTSSLPVCHD